MGKSTTAKMFADEGVPVWDADEVVHDLYSEGGAGVEPVAALCPDCRTCHGIDRKKLRSWIGQDKTRLEALENTVHPLVTENRRKFLSTTDAEIVLLDIPLLYETGAEKFCQAVVVVSAPPDEQRRRVLVRPDQTEENFRALLSRQMPDAEKRSRADYVIQTTTLQNAKDQIVLDTETTGFDPETGDRIVEIGAIELIGHIATDQKFHRYINPERAMPDDAKAVHGLDDEFLKDKPVFRDIGQAFLEFVGDAPLIIHNAAFDMRFINAELRWAGLPVIREDRAIDTLAIARRKFPGAPASLDALCRRFGIDNSARTVHGALVDSEILAEVYLELIGGRQPDFALTHAPDTETEKNTSWKPSLRPKPLAPRLTEAERMTHQAFINEIGAEELWRHRS
ncbi:unnamed protein product [Cyprideis torosa]|uniref:DNA polymerase III subunit epsilon n=1 Tax=Cyprideis torosa TaxID=163714 RepID=A0A7R8WSG0_9CRUS|nr:unnamed protein product [Cyprideis torosa]CAG0907643.1 unnamed protein product [Cyprideis torosa]